MNYTTLFSALPDEARIWIYLADRPLNDAEQTAMRQALHTFLVSWTSHGRTVQADAALLDGQFLIVAGVIPGGDISGCGIDASARFIEEAARNLNVQWTSPLSVTYRDETGALRSAPRPMFRDLARRGIVHTLTPVIDLSITTLGQLRNGHLERLAGEGWTADVFNLQPPVASHA
jgi:hypothetical protein